MAASMTWEVAAATKPEPTAKIGRKLPDVKPISFDGNPPYWKYWHAKHTAMINAHPEEKKLTNTTC